MRSFIKIENKIFVIDSRRYARQLKFVNPLFTKNNC